MKTNDLSAIDPAQRYPHGRGVEVDIQLIRKQPSLIKAITLCIQYGGFEYDKQVYPELEIDAGHWTRIMNGSAHFPVNKLEKLMDMCGNEIPLIWLADHRGYELKRRLSTIEAELNQERELNRILELKLEHLMEFAGLKSA